MFGGNRRRWKNLIAYHCESDTGSCEVWRCRARASFASPYHGHRRRIQAGVFRGGRRYGVDRWRCGDAGAGLDRLAFSRTRGGKGVCLCAEYSVGGGSSHRGAFARAAHRYDRWHGKAGVSFYGTRRVGRAYESDRRSCGGQV